MSYGMEEKDLREEKEELARKVVDRMQALLDERGIKKYKLAELSNLSHKTVDPIFSDCRLPELITLSRISKGFGITLSELLEFENSPKLNLSSDEREIIECYRHMPEEERRRMLGYFQGITKRDLLKMGEQ